MKRTTLFHIIAIGTLICATGNITMASPNKVDQVFLQANDEKVEIIPSPRLQLGNEYFKQKLAGTNPKIFLRKGVVTRLNLALTYLPKEYGFIIFDAFRTIETQWAIWNVMHEIVKKQHPSWTQEQVFQETLKFVSNPSSKGLYPVQPHNSGGAIDIGLTDANGNILDMGAAFDEISEKSATGYFDQTRPDHSEISSENWTTFSKRRHILTKALMKAGFTNVKEEWWHFDLGSCCWASQVDSKWYYPPME